MSLAILPLLPTFTERYYRDPARQARGRSWRRNARGALTAGSTGLLMMAGSAS